jgi:hypothetical protein
MGDHLATIDFIKTTGIGESAGDLLKSAETESDLYDKEALLTGYEKYQNRLFNKKKRWLRPIVGYPPGKRNVGSSVDEIDREVKRLRRYGFIGAVTLLVSVLLAFGPMFLDLKNDIQGAREENAKLRIELIRLQGDLEDMKNLPTPTPTSSE